jgi:plasmid stabilization system protein ParE
MGANLIIASEAVKDLAEAYDWYEGRRLALGEEFLSCVDASIQMICRIPEMYPSAYQTYRRGMVRRFPYAGFYRYANETVTVYAVFHASLDPEKWRERLS